MKKILIYTALLCLLNSILLVDQSLGINVILFTIPLLIFLVWILKENKLIKNKKGLLLIIPILMLSSTYFIYDNSLKYLNIIVIPVLYLLLYIFTIKPVNTFSNTIIEVLSLVVKPLNTIEDLIKNMTKFLPKKKKMSDETKKVIKSICIVIPIVAVVLMLLASADSIFGNLFENLFNIEIPSLDGVIKRVIIFIVLFLYLSSTVLFLKDYYLKEKTLKEKTKEKDPLTFKILFTTLNIIYLVFDIIQINSLLLHRVSSGFNYAEYARSGFFQLMVITIINLTMILLSKKTKEENYLKGMSIILVLLTYIIIVSSFFRMFLYEQAYGYTVLRLGVYAILITEGILLLPTIAYILNKKTNILNFYLVITISIYTFINCFSVDKIIAKNNINRYKKTGKIDIYYLENYNYDNINQLRDLKKIIDEDYDKRRLEEYLQEMDKKNKGNVLEYNLSKERAKKNSSK